MSAETIVDRAAVEEYKSAIVAAMDEVDAGSPPATDPVEIDGNLVDPTTGEILQRLGVPQRFEVRTLADAAWVLNKRARDERRLNDLHLAINREMDAVREYYAKQVAAAEAHIAFWARFDDQLEMIAVGETIDRKERSVTIGAYRIGFRRKKGGLRLRDGVVDKHVGGEPNPPLFDWLVEHAPSAIKTVRTFLISKFAKGVDQAVVDSAPDLFEITPDEDTFYVDTGVAKHERPATIQPDPQETPA